MSYSVSKSSFTATSYANLTAALREWLTTQIPELTLVRTINNTHGYTYVYSYGSETGGLAISYYYVSTSYSHRISLTSSYGISGSTSTQYSQSTSRSADLISLSGVTYYNIGIILTKTTNGYILTLSDYSQNVKNGTSFYMGYVTSTIQGEFFATGVIGTPYYLYYGMDTNGTVGDYPAYGTGRIILIKKGTSVYIMSSPYTLAPYANSSITPPTSVVIVPVYLLACSLWMEPIRFDNLYCITGLNYPTLFSPQSINGFNVMRVTSRLVVN